MLKEVMDTLAGGGRGMQAAGGEKNFTSTFHLQNFLEIMQILTFSKNYFEIMQIFT